MSLFQPQKQGLVRGLTRGLVLTSIEAVIIGPEEGSFDSNIDGWVGVRSASVAHDTGRLKITSGAQSFGSGVYDIVGQLVEGEAYTLTATITADAAVSARMFVGNSAASIAYSTEVSVTAGTTATRTIEFTATSDMVSNAHVVIGHSTGSTTPGYVAFADDVSLVLA